MHDRFSAERDGLIQQAQRITHAAFARPGEGRQAPIFDCDPVLIRHMAQPFDDFRFAQSGGNCNADNGTESLQEFCEFPLSQK